MSDPDFAQRTILGLLLGEHPRLMSLPELREKLYDVPRIDEAVGVLVADGLATRLGDLIGATRAATRYEALGL